MTFNDEELRRTRLPAAIRSLIFPGWGQWYQDRGGNALVCLLFVPVCPLFVVVPAELTLDYNVQELLQLFAGLAGLAWVVNVWDAWKGGII